VDGAALPTPPVDGAALPNPPVDGAALPIPVQLLEANGFPNKPRPVVDAVVVGVVDGEACGDPKEGVDELGAVIEIGGVPANPFPLIVVMCSYCIFWGTIIILYNNVN
jgi:hypothetical protein